jgi:hypothetical protein
MLLLKAGVHAGRGGDASNSAYCSVCTDSFDIHFFGSLAILRGGWRRSLRGTYFYGS